MSSHDICFASASEIAHRVGRGELSARDVTEAFLTRIGELDGRLNSFLQVTDDAARAQAKAVDDALHAGQPPGLLAGVPVGIKDLVDVAGVRTTNGADRRFHAMAAADAPVVARLRHQGAVIIGKTSLHEFAYGVTNNNPHFGPTRNPWDLTRIPGGSSGGSAAAVAAGLCAAAIGTDTGGSVRIPAALCGIVGIKPTYGVVPRSGVTPLAWTLDHVGPMTRTVPDAALLFEAMTTGAELANVRTRRPEASPVGEYALAGLRVGIPRPFFWEALDDDVHMRVEDAIVTLKRLGAVVVDVVVPHAAQAGDAAAVILAVEATAVHEHRFRTTPDAFGEDVGIRLASGFFLSGADYIQAQRARMLLRRAFLQVFERVDVLILPTTPRPASEIEAAASSRSSGPAPVRLALTRLTNPFNLTGLPALSVPCGLTSSKLPVGLQVVGRAFDEPTVFRVAHAFEIATGWTGRPEFGASGS